MALANSNSDKASMLKMQSFLDGAKKPVKKETVKKKEKAND